MNGDIDRLLRLLEQERPPVDREHIVPVEQWGGDSGAYAREHGGQRPGRVAGETEVEALANKRWSENFLRRYRRGPEQQEWVEHWQRYTTGQDPTWNDYLAQARLELEGPAEAPVKSYESGNYNNYSPNGNRSGQPTPQTGTNVPYTQNDYQTTRDRWFDDWTPGQGVMTPARPTPTPNDPNFQAWSREQKALDAQAQIEARRIAQEASQRSEQSSDTGFGRFTRQIKSRVPKPPTTPTRPRNQQELFDEWLRTQNPTSGRQSRGLSPQQAQQVRGQAEAIQQDIQQRESGTNYANQSFAALANLGLREPMSQQEAQRAYPNMFAPQERQAQVEDAVGQAVSQVRNPRREQAEQEARISNQRERTDPQVNFLLSQVINNPTPEYIQEAGQAQGFDQGTINLAIARANELNGTPPTQPITKGVSGRVPRSPRQRDYQGDINAQAQMLYDYGLTPEQVRNFMTGRGLPTPPAQDYGLLTDVVDQSRQFYEGRKNQYTQDIPGDDTAIVPWNENPLYAGANLFNPMNSLTSLAPQAGSEMPQWMRNMQVNAVQGFTGLVPGLLNATSLAPNLVGQDEWQSLGGVAELINQGRDPNLRPGYDPTGFMVQDEMGAYRNPNLFNPNEWGQYGSYVAQELAPQVAGQIGEQALLMGATAGLGNAGVNLPRVLGGGRLTAAGATRAGLQSARIGGDAYYQALDQMNMDPRMAMLPDEQKQAQAGQYAATNALAGLILENFGEAGLERIIRSPITNSVTRAAWTQMQREGVEEGLQQLVDNTSQYFLLTPPEQQSETGFTQFLSRGLTESVIGGGLAGGFMGGAGQLGQNINLNRPAPTAQPVQAPTPVSNIPMRQDGTPVFDADEWSRVQQRLSTRSPQPADFVPVTPVPVRATDLDSTVGSLLPAPTATNAQPPIELPVELYNTLEFVAARQLGLVPASETESGSTIYSQLLPYYGRDLREAIKAMALATGDTPARINGQLKGDLRQIRERTYQILNTFQGERLPELVDSLRQYPEFIKTTGYPSGLPVRGIPRPKQPEPVQQTQSSNVIQFPQGNPRMAPPQRQAVGQNVQPRDTRNLPRPTISKQSQAYADLNSLITQFNAIPSNQRRNRTAQALRQQIVQMSEATGVVAKPVNPRATTSGNMKLVDPRLTARQITPAPQVQAPAVTAPTVQAPQVTDLDDVEDGVDIAPAAQPVEIDDDIKRVQELLKAYVAKQTQNPTLGSGIPVDPEGVSLVAELAGLYVKKGVQQFQQFVESVRQVFGDWVDSNIETLQQGWDQAQPQITSSTPPITPEIGKEYWYITPRQKALRVRITGGDANGNTAIRLAPDGSPLPEQQTYTIPMGKINQLSPAYQGETQPRVGEIGPDTRQPIDEDAFNRNWGRVNELALGRTTDKASALDSESASPLTVLIPRNGTGDSDIPIQVSKDGVWTWGLRNWKAEFGEEGTIEKVVSDKGGREFTPIVSQQTGRLSKANYTAMKAIAEGNFVVVDPDTRKVIIPATSGPLTKRPPNQVIFDPKEARKGGADINKVASKFAGRKTYMKAADFFKNMSGMFPETAGARTSAQNAYFDWNFQTTEGVPSLTATVRFADSEKAESKLSATKTFTGFDEISKFLGYTVAPRVTSKANFSSATSPEKVRTALRESAQATPEYKDLKDSGATESDLDKFVQTAVDQGEVEATKKAERKTGRDLREPVAIREVTVQDTDTLKQQLQSETQRIGQASAPSVRFIFGDGKPVTVYLTGSDWLALDDKGDVVNGVNSQRITQFLRSAKEVQLRVFDVATDRFRKPKTKEKFTLPIVDEILSRSGGATAENPFQQEAGSGVKQEYGEENFNRILSERISQYDTFLDVLTGMGGRVDNRVVYVNPESLFVISNARNNPDADGIVPIPMGIALTQFGDLERVVQGLDEIYNDPDISEQGKERLEQLVDILIRSSENEDGSFRPFAIVNDGFSEALSRNTRRHELSHVGLSHVVDYLGGGLPNYDSYTSLVPIRNDGRGLGIGDSPFRKAVNSEYYRAGYSKEADYLTKPFKPGDTTNLRIMDAIDEVAAQIVGGSRQRLDLSLDEAAQFLGEFYRTIKTTYGAEAFEQYLQISETNNPLAERVRNERTTTQRTGLTATGRTASSGYASVAGGGNGSSQGAPVQPGTTADQRGRSTFATLTQQAQTLYTASVRAVEGAKEFKSKYFTPTGQVQIPMSDMSRVDKVFSEAVGWWEKNVEPQRAPEPPRQPGRIEQKLLPAYKIVRKAVNLPIQVTGKTLGVTGRTAFWGMVAGLGYILMDDDDELFWTDEFGRVGGTIPEAIDRSIAQLPETAQKYRDAFLPAALETLSQPSLWAESIFGSATTLAVGNGETWVGEALGWSKEDIEFIQNTSRANKSEWEKRAWWEAQRIFYSGPTAMRRAYEELSQTPNLDQSGIDTVLDSSSDWKREFLGRLAFDPLEVANAGLLFTRATKPLTGANLPIRGVQDYRAFRRAQQVMGEVNNSTTARFGEWFGSRIQKVFPRTSEALIMRDLRDALIQIEGRVAGITSVDDALPIIQDIFTGATKGRGLDPFLQPTNQRGVEWLTKIMSKGLADDVMTVVDDPTNLDQVRRFTTALLIDNLKPILENKYGTSNAIERGVQTINSIQKMILGNTLLRTPQFFVGNVMNNTTLAAIDGVLAIDNIPMLQQVFRDKVGYVPTFMDEAFNIAGQRLSGSSFVSEASEVASVTKAEQQAAASVYGAAFFDWYPRLWQRSVDGWSRNLKLPSNFLDELKGTWKEQDVRTLFNRFFATAEDGTNVVPTGVNLDDVLQLQRTTRAGAFGAADEMRRFTLLNYWDKSKYDRYIELMFPFAYWGTRNVGNWVVRAMDNPEFLSRYKQVEQAAINYMMEDDGSPLREPSYIQSEGIPISRAQLNRAGTAVADGIRALTQEFIGWELDEATLPKNLWGDFLVGQMDDGERLYVNLLSRGLALDSVFAFAPGSAYIPYVDEEEATFMTQALYQLNRLPAATSPFLQLTATMFDNYMNEDLLTEGHNEANIAFAYARPIRGATEIARQAGVPGIPVGGVDINAGARTIAGYEEGRPSYEEDRIVSRIADRVRLGEITPEQAAEAIAYQDGDVYNEAVAWNTRYYGDRGLTSFFTGFYPAADPHTELKAIADEYYRLRDTDPEQAEVFADNHPELFIYNYRDRDWKTRRGGASTGVFYDTTSYLRGTVEQDYPELVPLIDRLYRKEATNEERMQIAQTIRQAIKRDPDEYNRREFEQYLNSELDRLYNYSELDSQYDNLTTSEQRSDFFRANPDYGTARDVRDMSQAESGYYPRADEVWSQADTPPDPALLEKAVDMGIQGAGLSEQELRDWIAYRETGAAEIVGTDLEYIRYLQSKKYDGTGLSEQEKDLLNDFYRVTYDNMSQYDYDQYKRENNYSGSSGGGSNNYTSAFDLYVQAGVELGIPAEQAADIVQRKFDGEYLPEGDYDIWQAMYRKKNNYDNAPTESVPEGTDAGGWMELQGLLK